MAEFPFVAGQANARRELGARATSVPAKPLSTEEVKKLAETRGWSIARAQGYTDGVICRTRAETPSSYAMVGIDDYALGFRAGYFVRRSPDLPRAANVDNQFQRRIA